MDTVLGGSKIEAQEEAFRREDQLGKNGFEDFVVEIFEVCAVNVAEGGGDGRGVQ